ncbi:Substrate-specific component PanT of predicted pantothenate ECF transporter [Pediococcus damnosus]|uniref:ECF transporter S component n=1 Tax=Pediococcus damnosus TaxID=51663 RepID=UPI00078B497A|nr:ECF transporter S component [Pediococcus damnosus]AMV65526.1 Substrate-specific component PanT of predicted pantothenate ECF transporter [Pediococcus damnosus]
MGKNSSAARISILGLFAAIIILQNYVPMIGYIPVGPLNITTIHITVIIAAVVLGPGDGALIGGVWGIVDWIRALTVTSSALGNIVMVNPLISVLPRILIGLVAGWLFSSLVRDKSKLTAPLVVSGIAGSLTNTILVLGGIALFFGNGATVLHAINFQALTPYILFVAGTNGIPEAIAAAFLVPLIPTPLLKYTKLGKERFKRISEVK